MLSVVGCNVGVTMTIAVSSSVSSLKLVKCIEDEITNTFIVRIKHVDFMQLFTRHNTPNLYDNIATVIGKI